MGCLLRLAVFLVQELWLPVLVLVATPSGFSSNPVPSLLDWDRLGFFALQPAYQSCPFVLEAVSCFGVGQQAAFQQVECQPVVSLGQPGQLRSTSCSMIPADCKSI